MTQSCSFQNLHVIKQFYSFSYLYVLVLTNQKTFSVRSHGRYHVKSHGRSHGRYHVKSHGRYHVRSHGRYHVRSHERSHGRFYNNTQSITKNGAHRNSGQNRRCLITYNHTALRHTESSCA